MPCGCESDERERDLAAPFWGRRHRGGGGECGGGSLQGLVHRAPR